MSAWIRLRRLERCRRDLRDPRAVDRPVSAIAATWGLPDPAHFSRTFRAAYGITPTEYRSGVDLFGKGRRIGDHQHEAEAS